MPTNLGHRVLPCLLVSDMRRSLHFYLSMLGFIQTGYYPIESDPIRTEVRRDDVAIILLADATRVAAEKPALTGALYMFPESVDDLANELRGKVTFAWGPEDTDFGLREFAISDPDGYTLVFATRIPKKTLS
jgi:catechol 2,3-dioxygenase-like lactoylglutathione lyase family enzyme